VPGAVGNPRLRAAIGQAERDEGAAQVVDADAVALRIRGEQLGALLLQADGAKVSPEQLLLSSLSLLYDGARRGLRQPRR
jgi:hypothetical protein